MKKAFIISILFVWLCLMLTGCSSSVSGHDFQGTKDSLGTNNTSYPNVVLSSDSYIITEEQPFVYRYTIFNSEGETVLNETVDGRMPSISMLNTDIIDVSVGYGTGIVKHIFYSISRDRLSEPFEYVVAASDQIVAYIDVPPKDPFEGRRLIIRDIFDSTVFCEEFTFDFSRVDTPVVATEFCNNGAQLQLTYLAGEEQIETTITLTLNLP